MPAIFISHSSLDQTIASELTAAIKHLGFEEVFLDFDKDTGIGAGADWARTLYEKLSRCHAVVLVLTPNWLSSKWCFAELQQARALGKVILPVVFSPLGDSYVLPDIQAIDMIDWRQEGLARLEQRLNAITHELARGFRLEPGRPPYPGFHAFEAEDAAIYFGRDDETRAVIEKLDARRRQGGTRSLLVIGASGAGKSSLLKAGVLPQLARRRAHWLLIPVMRPEKTPLEALAKVLAQRLGEENDWRALYDELSGAKAVGRIGQLAQDLRVGEGRTATILIAIDQFEELFTIAAPGERAALLALLAAILDPARGLPVMMIATGRADVLQGLLETGPLAPLMDTMTLLPMPLERVPLLVEGPAAVASLFVEKELPERIMRDVENPEALPLLAYMLRLLYARSPDKRLTLATYLTLGKEKLNPVQNAVRLGADDAIADVKPSETEMAALRDAFIPHLVRLRLDDKRHVRQPAPLAALPREAERSIKALIEERLLTSRTSDHGVPIVEVVHEALFSAWPTLKDWLAKEQDFLADIERLKSAYETWKQAAEPQKPQALLRGLLLSRARDWLIRYPQRFASPDLKPLGAFIADSAAADDRERARSQQLRRRVFQAMVGAVIFFAAIAAFAGWQYHEAARATDEAEMQRKQAQHNFAIAKHAADDMVAKLARGLRDVPGMRIDSVRMILDEARMLIDQLAQAAPYDLDLQRSRTAMLDEFVDTYLAVDDLGSARAAAQQSLAIARRLADADRGNVLWQLNVGVSLSKVGDVRRAAGDRDGAREAYEEDLKIERAIADAQPGDARWQRELSVSLNKAGDARRATNDRAGALAAYEEGLVVARNLADAEPGNTKSQRDVNVSLDKVGDARLAVGNRAGALAAYEEALASQHKLADAELGNTQLQRDLSVSLNKVGNMKLADGDRAGALAAYNESLRIIGQLADADPGNDLWQNDLFISWNKVGDAKFADNDRGGALAAYQEGHRIMSKLAGDAPGNAESQANLFVNLYKVGAASDPPAARKAFDEALSIAEGLARGGKLAAYQSDWPRKIRDALANLPADDGKAK